MPSITTYRGETSVSKIADTLYANLTDRTRKQAVKALIQANPRLRAVRTMKRGTVLRVPDLPSLKRRRAEEELADPSSDLTDTVTRDLQVYAKLQAERHAAYQADLKAQAEMMRDKTLRKAISANPALRDMAKKLSVEIRNRAQVAKEEQKAVTTALKTLTTDLAKRKR